MQPRRDLLLEVTTTCHTGHQQTGQSTGSVQAEALAPTVQELVSRTKFRAVEYVSPTPFGLSRWARQSVFGQKTLGAKRSSLHPLQQPGAYELARIMVSANQEVRMQRIGDAADLALQAEDNSTYHLGAAVNPTVVGPVPDQMTFSRARALSNRAGGHPFQNPLRSIEIGLAFQAMNE